MNRYVIEGLVTDLLNGKNVLLLAARRDHSVQAFKAVIELLTKLDATGHVNIRRTNGDERISAPFSGGNLRVGTATGQALRGVYSDVVVLLDGLRPIERSRRWEQVQEGLALIRANRPGGVEIIACE